MDPTAGEGIPADGESVGNLGGLGRGASEPRIAELNESDFDLSLTGFAPGEIDGLLAIPAEEKANAAPPLPENPNRILKAHLSSRLRLWDAERSTLAEIAKRLGHKALKDVARLAKPDTLLAWYRRLVAHRFDRSRHRA